MVVATGLLSTKRCTKSSKSSSSRNFLSSSSWRCRSLFCLFVCFDPAASGSSRPEDANAASRDPSAASPSPSNCSQTSSLPSTTPSSSSSPSPLSAAARASTVARANRAIRATFAAVEGPSPPASSSSLSSSSWPSSFLLASSASSPSSLSTSSPSQTELHKLVNVSSEANSPSSRQATRAASRTRLFASTKSSQAIRGTTASASLRCCSAFFFFPAAPCL
mmetsp:Transcript_9021/g.23548  ORF Transcript_9021/g.23548 Transcript_9021/m.23548 type:complete len:221 (-) Transcript_9021:902-1564(-)